MDFPYLQSKYEVEWDSKCYTLQEYEVTKGHLHRPKPHSQMKANSEDDFRTPFQPLVLRLVYRIHILAREWVERMSRLSGFSCISSYEPNSSSSLNDIECSLLSHLPSDSGWAVRTQFRLVKCPNWIPEGNLSSKLFLDYSASSRHCPKENVILNG
jgi:hypothetical protein